MRVRCPNCSHPIELVNDVTEDNVVCPSCGSRIGLLGSDETATLDLTAQIPALKFFELLQPVGSGQFGGVWKAHDNHLDRTVAIKIPHKHRLSPSEAAFFLREARAAAQLSHEHIVRVFEVGREESTVYIVSEYIDGGSLREWMKTYRPDARESARICAQVARALHHAHEKGIVHRDLKPANIVMDADRQPHVTDFGLAKQEGAEITIAATGHILGTPAYMAPEQIRDGHSAERRSDVYSLGVVLYEMLTEQRPYAGSKRVLLQQVLHDEPPSPRHVNKRIPKDLETICLQAMAKRPDQRYATAGEMAEDLERFSRGEPIRARRTPAPVRAARWVRKRPALTIAAVLAVVLLILLPVALRGPKQVPLPSRTARTVYCTTRPAGAQVVFIPLNDRSGVLEPERAMEVGKSPARPRLEPGDYLVVAYLDDQLFHEVYRHVPAKHEKLPGIFPHNAWRAKNGVVSLATITLYQTRSVARNMARVRSGEFTMRNVDLAGKTRVHVPGFFVDVTETTLEDISGARFKPPHHLKKKPPSSDYPITSATWDEAAMYAEGLGKRLVREAEFQYLVTQGGTRVTSDGWKPEASQAGPTTAPIYDRLSWSRVDRTLIGLRSNVMEWTADWWAAQGVGRDQRIVRGGYGTNEITKPKARRLAPNRLIYPRPISNPNIGFRCARSTHPRIKPEDFIQRMDSK